MVVDKYNVHKNTKLEVTRYSDFKFVMQKLTCSLM
jgi:hypothetical protein